MSYHFYFYFLNIDQNILDWIENLRSKLATGHIELNNCGVSFWRNFNNQGMSFYILIGEHGSNYV